MLLGVGLTACGASPSNVVSNNDSRPTQATGTSVANQQTPINQRFGSLDEYLAFLERTNPPIDKPWYREVRPGVYELVAGGNLRILGADGEEQPTARIFTREELERKFGFRK